MLNDTIKQQQQRTEGQKQSARLYVIVFQFQPRRYTQYDVCFVHWYMESSWKLYKWNIPCYCSSEIWVYTAEGCLSWNNTKNAAIEIHKITNATNVLFEELKIKHSSCRERKKKKKVGLLHFNQFNHCKVASNLC